MGYCPNCGKEVSSGTSFCGSCGSAQKTDDNCSKCGKALEGNEKFCSSCGNSVGSKLTPQLQPIQELEPKAPEGKFTKEGKKIITGTPNPDQSQQVPPPPSMAIPKKKKRGCFGCFFRTLLIVIIIILVIIGVKFILSKINSPADYKSDSIELIYPGHENNLVVPGGQTKRNKNDKLFENEELKEVTNELESIFENSDIEKLKLILSESALEQYGDDFEKLKPLMPNFAKAFKTRKLITSTDFYKVYEFSDDKGETYTATFEFQPGKTWKLTRF